MSKNTHNRKLSIRLATFLTLLFITGASVVIGYSKPVSASTISEGFTIFLENARHKNAEDKLTKDFAFWLNNKSFNACKDTKSYSSGIVDGYKADEAWSSLVAWFDKAKANPDKSSNEKAKSLANALYGELAGSGMTMEYSAENNSEGWCAFTLRSANSVKIPIIGTKAESNNETEAKSINTSATGKNCSADFGDASGGLISLPVDVQSFLNGLDDATYKSVRGIVTNTATVGSSIECQKLTKALDSQIKEFSDAYCKNDPTDAKCIPSESGGAVNEEPSCGNQVSGMGWILCPIIDGLSGLNDAMWGLVSGLLNVSPLRADGSDAVYKAWGTIRSIANVTFIIVFLIMIFSQLTSFGISNYGVKKLLPRLLISALLVNLSFVVVQLAVDLANIVGSSLYGLLANLASDSVQPSWDNLIQLILGGAGGAGLLVGGLAIAGGIGTAFWLLLPAVAMGALGLLAAVFTLIFRQAVIPILAILAPLAFVAYLLPNTEQWFKKWRDLLVSMLMLYPLAALVFGGSQFAADVIIGDAATWWSTLLGLIVLTLPLFSLPFLVKQGGPLLGKVGGALSNLAQKARDPIKNATRPYADRSRANYQSGQRGMFGNRRSEQSRARRRTMGESLNETRKNVEKDTENAKSTSERNWSQRGLTGTTRSGRKTRQALDEEKTLGLENKAIGAQYDARLDTRRVRSGRERMASDRLSDSEKTSAAFQELEKFRQIRRTNSGAESTVAGAVGVAGAGVESLADLSQAQYLASKGVAAAEAQIQARNDTSGVADEYIQQEKAAKDDTKTAEAQQDTVFKVSRETDPGLIANSQAQYAAEQSGAASDSVVKASREQEAQIDPEMIETRHRKENADAAVSGIETARATELKERTVTDDELREIDMNRRADEQAAKEASDESLGQYAQAVSEKGSDTQVRAGGTINPNDGQAKAAAFGMDARDKLRSENVSAYRTRFKSEGIPDTKNPDVPDTAGNGSLVGVVIDPTASSEMREAATRAIIEGGNIDTIVPAMDYLVAEQVAAKSARTEAVSRGDAAAAEAADARLAELKPQIQAAGETISSSPGKSIAWGAGEISAMRVADYTPPKEAPDGATAEGKKAFETLGATEKQLVSTLTTKGITEKGVPGIDKRDLASILKLAQQGVLPPQTSAAIRDKLDIALSDPDIYTDIKGREVGYILRAMEQLEVNMTNGGITLPERRPRLDRAGNETPATAITDLAAEFQTVKKKLEPEPES